MRPIRAIAVVAGLSLAISAHAVSITVAPTTGTGGGNPTNTIADAIAQVNAGADANNTIVLRSTEGAHILPATAGPAGTPWMFASGKNVSFTAESGQPVVRLSTNGGGTTALAQYMLTINAGVSNTVSFTGIAFVPPTALAYANNVKDGISGTGGNYVFTNCVFSSNNGTDGVASQEGAVAYAQSPGGNNVGDDWMQFSTSGSVTLSNCTVTGAADDGVLIGAGPTGGSHTLLINQGTCIANNGGAAIQLYATSTTVNLDGSAARIVIADNGRRSAAADTGPKFFWDDGCALQMTKTDVVGHTNGGIFDFEGVPVINITDSRIAFNNSSNTATASNFSIDDQSADSAYGMSINFTRVTVHDAGGGTNPQGIAVADGATDPVPNFTIIDSIFSGAGDTFDMLNGTNGTVSQSFSAVVTAGTHAVAGVGSLGAGAVSADPQYVSLTYTIGRGQANPDFLLPAAAAYANASSAGVRLKGGAPGTVAGIKDWSLY